MTQKTEMLSYAEAVGAAIIEEMQRDKRVVMWGVEITRNPMFVRVLNVLEAFRADRVMNTPIVEVAIVEMAVGAALTGLRPIAFLMSGGFFPLCFDATFLKLGDYYQVHNYKDPVPVVIHATLGTEPRADHGLSPEALLMHSPGLKVVMPSTPYDAKGLMKAAIRDDYPVVYLQHAALNSVKGPVPSEEYIIPLGKADVKKKGNDVTIVTYSAMVVKALAAAEALSKEGISVEVVDLRCLVPLDVEAIVTSMKKTGRLLVVHEAMKRAGAAGEIAFRVTEAAPDVVRGLKVCIKRLGAKNVALPQTAELEKMIVPQVDDIIKAVKDML